MRSTSRIETMVLPEPSRTMAYTPCKTEYRLACEQLHLNKASKVKVSLFVYLILKLCSVGLSTICIISQPFESSLWGNLERNFKDRFCWGKDLTKYDRNRDYPVETVGITGLRENSGRDGGIEEPYWGPSSQRSTKNWASHIGLWLWLNKHGLHSVWVSLNGSLAVFRELRAKGTYIFCFNTDADIMIFFFHWLSAFPSKVILHQIF